jgi:3-deoxy-D-manno-octulosonic acid kinase
MRERQIRTAAGSILYDATCVVKPDDALFTREYWSGRTAVAATTGGRGQVVFIRDGSRHWVLRHYRRGGLIARWVDDSYLWTGEDHTRSFCEWRLLSLLHQEGFPVPVPVAARYIRSGLGYRADIITTEIPDARTLADRITGAALPPMVWKGLGTVIARLHHRGVHHVDLNAHNVLVGAGNDVHVIDFDRARVRESGAWQDAVLSRLKRSLEKIKRQRADVRFGDAEWQALRDGYRGGSIAGS